VGFNIEQRIHEISVRMALGAQRSSVLGMIVRQESVPVVIGVAVGVAGAIAVGRAMRTLLFNVAPADPVTFIAMPVLRGAVATGVAAGVAGASAGGGAMRPLLFTVAPADPVTFIAMPVLLGAVALVACLVPARRTLDVDPVNGLRSE